MSGQQNPPKKEVHVVGFQAEHHSGPIPPPAILDQYNQIVPGAAERILKMAENQTAHRINIESIVIKTDARNSTLGVICALIITLGVLALAAYALALGQTLTGGFLGTIGIGSIVGTFIYGTRSRQHERQQRFNK